MNFQFDKKKFINLMGGKDNKIIIPLQDAPCTVDMIQQYILNNDDTLSNNVFEYTNSSKNHYVKLTTLAKFILDNYLDYLIENYTISIFGTGATSVSNVVNLKVFFTTLANHKTKIVIPIPELLVCSQQMFQTSLNLDYKVIMMLVSYTCSVLPEFQAIFAPNELGKLVSVDAAAYMDVSAFLESASLINKKKVLSCSHVLGIMCSNDTINSPLSSIMRNAGVPSKCIPLDFQSLGEKYIEDEERYCRVCNDLMKMGDDNELFNIGFSTWFIGPDEVPYPRYANSFNGRYDITPQLATIIMASFCTKTWNINAPLTTFDLSRGLLLFWYKNQDNKNLYDLYEIIDRWEDITDYVITTDPGDDTMDFEETIVVNDQVLQAALCDILSNIDMKDTKEPHKVSLIELYRILASHQGSKLIQLNDTETIELPVGGAGMTITVEELDNFIDYCKTTDNQSFEIGSNMSCGELDLLCTRLVPSIAAMMTFNDATPGFSKIVSTDEQSGRNIINNTVALSMEALCSYDLILQSAHEYYHKDFIVNNGRYSRDADLPPVPMTHQEAFSNIRKLLLDAWDNPNYINPDQKDFFFEAIYFPLPTDVLYTFIAAITNDMDVTLSFLADMSRAEAEKTLSFANDEEKENILQLFATEGYNHDLDHLLGIVDNKFKQYQIFEEFNNHIPPELNKIIDSVGELMTISGELQNISSLGTIEQAQGIVVLLGMMIYVSVIEASLAVITKNKNKLPEIVQQLKGVETYRYLVGELPSNIQMRTTWLMPNNPANSVIQSPYGAKIVSSNENISWAWTGLTNPFVVSYNYKEDIMNKQTNKKSGTLTENKPTAGIILSEQIMNQCDKELFNFYGRNGIIEKVVIASGKKDSPNAIIIAPTGSGKTTFLKSIAYKSEKGEIQSFPPKSIVMHYYDAGQKPVTLLNELIRKENPPKAILLDDFSNYVAEDTGFITFIKRANANGISIITTSTPQAYKDFHEKKLFTPITLPKLQATETNDIITNHINDYKNYHNVDIPQELIAHITRNASIYLRGKVSPQRELNLLDAACSSAKNNNEPKLRLEDIHNAVNILANRTNNNIITSNNAFEDIVGQTEAKQIITDRLNAAALGLYDERRPRNIFMFVGPSGVGKTMLAEKIPEYLGKDPHEDLLELAMEEYTQPHEASRLIGAPPGYIGYDEGGILTNFIMKHPDGIIIFNEIEKAHPEVTQTLLSILDTGYVNDSQGNRINSTGTTIIFTSNEGYNNPQANKTIGFNQQKPNHQEQTNYIKNQLINKLGAPFIGRMDETILFTQLTPEETKQALLKNANRLLTNYSEKFNVTINELINPTQLNKTIQQLIEENKTTQTGIRGLWRSLEGKLNKHIRTHLLKELTNQQPNKPNHNQQEKPTQNNIQKA